MNKLRKLFSPTALAVVATGLLVTTSALAVDCRSTSAMPGDWFPGCGPGEISCDGVDTIGQPVFYCCADTEVCSGVTGKWSAPPEAPAYGWVLSRSVIRAPAGCEEQVLFAALAGMQAPSPSPSSHHLPDLYLVGIPGKIGGASTKILHLLRLLRRDFNITVVLPDIRYLKEKRMQEALEPYGLPCTLVKKLPGKLEGVALGICDGDFFTSGRARDLKERGLKIVWSNEMMWAFKGEAEAAKEGLIDRVLFVSEFQAKAFEEIYRGVPSFHTGNYIDPDDYTWRERRNPTFTIGRLSRPDLKKYPLDFPVFYEELGLPDVRYRVMAWSQELQRQYRWHRFGPQWELLSAQKESALRFLYSLDVFLYPLGHRIKESWGRAVVEAMLTGAVPVVPGGHQFHKLMVHAESGFICDEYRQFKGTVRELYENYPLRMKISHQAAEYAREHLCDPEAHRLLWLEALSF